LLACLGTLGPFSIDTYLPAFQGIAQSLGATPAQMQQTLSAYLFGFALMNLFHGALSDALRPPAGRAGGLALFTLAQRGLRSSQNIGALVAFRALQGMSAGRGRRGVARHHPRHVPAGRRAAGDVAGHHLLRRGPGHCAGDGRAAVRAPGLALHLLAAGPAWACCCW
jgi:MFS family permease